MGNQSKVISFEEFSAHPKEVFEQVLQGEEIIVQRGNGESVALNLVDSLNGKELPPERIAAFLSAAGGWGDMDTETLKAQLHASHDMPPPRYTTI